MKAKSLALLGAWLLGQLSVSNSQNGQALPVQAGFGNGGGPNGGGKFAPQLPEPPMEIPGLPKGPSGPKGGGKGGGKGGPKSKGKGGKNKGIVCPPYSKGWPMPPPGSKGKGFPSPPGSKGKGFPPPPGSKGKGFSPPPGSKGKGFPPPPGPKGKGFPPPPIPKECLPPGKGKGGYPCQYLPGKLKFMESASM